MGNSILNLKQMLVEYAVRSNFPNPTHFTDDGISGTRFDRPSFVAMMEEVEAGRVEAVIVKGMSGKHRTGQVPYGYLLADEKREHWVIDDDAAVVRQTFSLTMEGFGPYQISQLLTQHRINAEVFLVLVAEMLRAVSAYSKSD